MPDDFQAEEDLRVLSIADVIQRDGGRVKRARRFAERKADEMRQIAENLPTARAKPLNGSPRETSFKKGK